MTSSWDSSSKITNATKQGESIALVAFGLQEYSGGVNLVGIAIHEFSDEWWRSDLSKVGFDEKGEGCPNSNAYAHTSCGILVAAGGSDTQSIFSVEFTGLFELLNLPFRFCVVPKTSARTLQKMWAITSSSPNNKRSSPAATAHTETTGGGKASATDAPILPGQAYCSFIPAVVPWVYVVPTLSGLSLTVFLLLLSLPAPKPTKVKDRELKQIIHDDFDLKPSGVGLIN